MLCVRCPGTELSVALAWFWDFLGGFRDFFSPFLLRYFCYELNVGTAQGFFFLFCFAF